MSLAPAERRALARIEDSLCRSDPRLARMLTQFRLPLSRGGLKGLARRFPALRPYLSLIIALAVALVFILVLMLSPSMPLRCEVSSRPGTMTAASQGSHCPTANYNRSYEGGYGNDPVTGQSGNG